jgi:hypothetical protein
MIIVFGRTSNSTIRRLSPAMSQQAADRKLYIRSGDAFEQPIVRAAADIS